MASIRFKSSLVPWLCAVINQACRESNPASLTRCKDDGNKIILVKGHSNDLGKFLKISEILRNGKEFRVFIPGDVDCLGRANVAYILQRSFNGDIPICPQMPNAYNDSFPSMNVP